MARAGPRILPRIGETGSGLRGPVTYSHAALRAPNRHSWTVSHPGCRAGLLRSGWIRLDVSPGAALAAVAAWKHRGSGEGSASGRCPGIPGWGGRRLGTSPEVWPGPLEQGHTSRQGGEGPQFLPRPAHPGPGVDLKAGQALPFLYWTSGAGGLPGVWGPAEGPAGHPTVSLGHGLLSLGTLQLLL